MFTYSEKDAFWYLHLNEQQSSAYDRFRAALEQANQLVPGVDDKCSLLRFLKARQWDVDKAMVMYLKMSNWRKEHDVDGLYDTYEFPELDQVIPFYPHFYYMVDKFGRPVYIELVGKIDCAKLLTVTTEKRLLDYHIYTWERFHKQLMPACSVLANRPICTASVILDLAGLGIMSFSLVAQRLLSALAQIDQDYYPESLGVMFIINTPFIFKTVWAFVNPMLEERTRKKIHVLGTDYINHLKEVIPEQHLLKMFGGKGSVTDYSESIGPWTQCDAFKSRPWRPIPRDKHGNAIAQVKVSSTSSGTILAVDDTA